MKKLLLLSTLTLAAASLCADTYVWTGNANNNDVSDAGNWTLNGSVPATAPTAGTDTREFKNGSLNVSTLELYNTDTVESFTLTATGDCGIWGDITFKDSTVTIYTICRKTDAGFTGTPKITLNGSTLKTTRTDQRLGFYDPSVYESAINFVSTDNKASSFIYSTSSLSAVTGQDSTAYAQFVSNKNMVLDGAQISESDWTDKFSVALAEGFTTVTYNPVGILNKISASATETTSTSATLTASIINADSGATLYFLVSANEITDEALTVSSTSESVSGTATVTKNVNDLTAGKTYYFRFGIVVSGSLVSSAGGSFIATDYDCTYENGAWTPNTPTFSGTEKILFKDAITLDKSSYDNKTFASFTVDVGEGKQVTVADYTGITLTGMLTIKSGSLAPVENVHSWRLSCASLVLDGGSYALSGDSSTPVTVNGGSLTASGTLSGAVTVNGGSLTAYNTTGSVSLNGGTLTLTGAGNISFTESATADRYTITGGTLYLPAELAIGSKTVRDAKISATTYTGGGDDAYLEATNTHIVSRRAVTGLATAAYGLWQSSTKFNFVREAPSAANTFGPVCAFTFNYSSENNWEARSSSQIYTDLFNSKLVLVDGAQVASEEAFLDKFLVLTNTTASTQTVTMFDALGSGAAGSYTLKDGAFVRLTGDVSLDALTLEGADSVIDLAGHKLKVATNGLTINGETVASGAYTAATLGKANIIDTVGGGTVSVATRGLVIILR